MKRLVAMMCIMAGSAVLAAGGQDAGEAAEVMTLAKAWQYGGWIMWVLLGMSMVAVAISVYFLFVLRSEQIVPTSLVRELLQRLKGDDPAEVRRLCEDHPSPVSSVVIVTLDAIRNAPRCDYSLIRNVAETEGTRQADLIQGQTQYLLDIAVIAPMIGLLGTVIGMLTAFGAIATDISAAKPTMLAAGVSQAIITTIFGLAVAIPSMIAYAYFRRRASREIANFESVSAELLAVIGGRYGHQ